MAINKEKNVVVWYKVVLNMVTFQYLSIARRFHLELSITEYGRHHHLNSLNNTHQSLLFTNSLHLYFYLNILLDNIGNGRGIVVECDFLFILYYFNVKLLLKLVHF